MCSLFATKILKFLSYTDRIAKLKYVGYADKLDESLNLEAIYSLVNNVLPLAENGGKTSFNQNKLFWLEKSLLPHAVRLLLHLSG